MTSRPGELRQAVEAAVLAGGADAVGVAPAAPFESTRAILEERKGAGLAAGMQFTYRNPARSTDPSRSLRGATSLVVAARRYRRADESDDADTADAGDPRSPTGAVARYSWEDHYEPLRAALGRGAEVLTAAGFRTRVLVDDNALVDRAAAVRAGLGAYGKNSNVLLPGLGSWFVLGSLLTDADLGDPGPAAADPCGACSACLPACPTGALVAPGVLDARACLAWLLEAAGDFPRQYRKALGVRVYGCDDCQEVCPPNRVADRRMPPPPAGPASEATVDLLDMLGAPASALMERFGRWYVADRDPRYLRRNALLALGNAGVGDDPRVESTLVRFIACDDVMLRRHAVWAAVAAGRADLAARAADDDDPTVRDELRAALAAQPD